MVSTTPYSHKATSWNSCWYGTKRQNIYSKIGDEVRSFQLCRSSSWASEHSFWWPSAIIWLERAFWSLSVGFDPEELPAQNSSHNPGHILDISQSPVKVVQACLQDPRGPGSWSSPLEGWPVPVCKLLDMTRQSRVSNFGHVDRVGRSNLGCPHSCVWGPLQDRTGHGARDPHALLEI